MTVSSGMRIALIVVLALIALLLIRLHSAAAALSAFL
jgi:hypothetical protein